MSGKELKGNKWKQSWKLSVFVLFWCVTLLILGIMLMGGFSKSTDRLLLYIEIAVFVAGLSVMIYNTFKKK